MTLQHDILGPVPVTVLHCRLQIRTMVSVEVGENAVLVLESAMVPHGRSLLHGREGAGGRPLGAEGAGGELGEGGSRGSRRSRYHDDGLKQCVEGIKRSWRKGKGELH